MYDEEDRDQLEEKQDREEENGEITITTSRVF
jgi:hypothetical protein